MPSSPRPKPLLEHAAAEAEARRLVDEALTTGADSLVLDGLRINRLPEGLRALAPQLRRLSLRNCLRISDLKPLSDLDELQELALDGCERVEDLSTLGALPKLRTLGLAWCRNIRDLTDLLPLTTLRSLDLCGCPSLRDLSTLSALKNLETLTLLACTNIFDLSPLSQLNSLQSLNLGGCVVGDLSPLESLHRLQSLNISSLHRQNDLAVLASLTDLQSLGCGGYLGALDLSALSPLGALKHLRLGTSTVLSNWSFVRELSALESLDLSECPQLRDLSNLSPLGNLQSLELGEGCDARELSVLKDLPSLRSLRLRQCETLVELSAVASLSEFRHLSLWECPRLRDLNALGSLPDLQSLVLGFCPAIKDFAPLGELRHLEYLSLWGCHQFRDPSILRASAKLQSLNLAGCYELTDLSVLESLTQLRALDLDGCRQISDLSSLHLLPALQSLDISRCGRISDLSSLSGSTALEELRLNGCVRLGDLSGLQKLQTMRRLTVTNAPAATFDPDWVHRCWPRLQHLSCDTARTVPRELQSENTYGDCLPRLEHWLADLHTTGSAPCDTIKLFVLGNGRAGKTQIVRRLQGLKFDDTVPSTHGVRTGQLPLLTDIGLRAQVWDFGGQDIYLGTHSLFLDDRAIYLLVWTPTLENDDSVLDNGIEMHNKRLAHWLAHVRAMVGPRAPVLVVQSQCDRESLRLEAPVPEQHGFDWLQRTACSAQQPDGLDRLWPELRAAARLLHERHGDTLLPRSWVAVRDQLRASLQTRTHVMPRADYDALCSEHDVGAPDATLAYLHQAGEVFSLPGVFNGDVVLDQAWALDGLYALLHRQQVLPILRQNRGHFTRELLGALIWDAQGFSAAEQDNFLSMMQRCGVCFSLGDGHYLAPDCLPGLDAVQPRVDALWRGQPPVVQVKLDYQYLHDGLLRTLVSKLGESAGLEAVYWRYGAAFYDAKAGTAVMVDCRQGDDPLQPFAGTVRLAASEPRGRELLNRLAKVLIDAAALAEPPEQQWSDAAGAATGPEPRRHPEHADDPRSQGANTPVIEAAQPPVAPGAMPAVHVSYAWGGDSEAWVDALEQELAGCCTWRRDKGVMRPGDWISTFMDEIADARCVVLVVSDKSLKSPYCMRELLGLFQTSNGHKNRVLERIVPVVMPDAAIDTTPQRMARVRHWREIYETNVASTQGLDAAELGQEFVHEQQLITEFRTRVADILKWVSDVLMPRPGVPGPDPSVQVVAAAVRQRLGR